MTIAARDRVLVLLRHAKAQQHHPDGDHDRELSDRGRRDARAAGRWLHDHGIGVDEVLCSTSERTQQTAEEVWAGGCPETEVHLDRRIYNAGPEGLLEVLREAEDGLAGDALEDVVRHGWGRPHPRVGHRDALFDHQRRHLVAAPAGGQRRRAGKGRKR